MGTLKDWLLLFFTRMKKPVEAKVMKEVNPNIANDLHFLFPKESLLPSEFIQSYLLSASKHPFSEGEKNVLYRLVECIQLDKEDQHMDSFLRKNPNGEVDIALFLKDGEDLMQIKKSLDELQKRTIHYEAEGVWTTIHLLLKPRMSQSNRTVTLRLYQEVYEALLHLPYKEQMKELEAIMSFRSIYTKRFYELLKGQNNSIHYNMENIRTLLGVENKYKKTNNFLTRVIDTAMKELNQKGTFSFTYQLEYEKKQNPKGGNKKVIGIIITPVYHPEQMDNISPMQETKQQLSESDEQDSVRTVLRSMFGFSGDDLVRLTDVVLKNGGHSYLAKLLQSCKGNIEKVKEKLKQLS
ncbi:MAG: hypothetical protein Pg6B_09590 [Candidatus Azobacteroides pseudotrichonymphae]|nr:MAG: hypothetical protein Pg6B_09590 [Candidatus Azobacteroides pseudotrichonymphae]